MIVDLYRYPAAKRLYTVDFPRLTGGLNISELDYRLKVDESPNMRNLWWQDGVLQCRDGQLLVSDRMSDDSVGYACYEGTFYGFMFAHIGDGIYFGRMDQIADSRSKGDVDGNGKVNMVDSTLISQYITDPTLYPLPDGAEHLADMNSDGTIDSQDTDVLRRYLTNPKKYPLPGCTVKLCSDVPENPGVFFRYKDFLAYKNRGGFYRIKYTPGASPVFSVESVADSDTAYIPTIVLNASPSNGSGTKYESENRLSPKKKICYNAASGVNVYHLPVQGVDSVDEVVVDGVTLQTGFEVNLAAGIVTFSSAPPVTDPPTNNTVEITYSKVNPDAYSSVMDCNRAVVYGGADGLCILLAGCPAQPNAVFWNGNSSLAMDDSYWPAANYNLVGGTEEYVTGFGKQYNDLIVFKEHSVGSLTYGVETVDDLNRISFTYKTINSKTGCDLPDSIQLIENNLVFANTYQGVHILRSSSAAYENNIKCISEKVNGAYSSQATQSSTVGLLYDLRHAKHVCSFDDDNRYWLNVDDKVYMWDYVLSTHEDPSWFYHTNISAVGFFLDDMHTMYHMDSFGRITKFGRYFFDYEDQPIDKLYQFPVQFFGGYDRLKDVSYILLSVRSDTDTTVGITYKTDYEERKDLTPIQTYTWRIAPRDLSRRSLTTSKFAFVAKRKPGCRHIRHFSVILSNNEPRQDLAIVSMQIFYNYQGKER